MAKQRHLSRAPITEALIDIQVAPREGLTFAELKSAVEGAATGYYVKNPISEGMVALQLAPDGLHRAASETAPVGLRLHSVDEKYVAQFRLSGFTLSRLPLYENWENLVGETRRLWAVYVECLAPKRIVRVATRFINNLRLPLANGVSFQTYFHKLVDVPDEAPQAVEAFFQRFQLIDAPSGARVILTLVLDGVPAGERIPVILDVDAFMATELNPADVQVWTMLERLRELKNRSFFGTITEEAVELYG
jgi:uncharacterized protein (TIGR04255 family)